MTIASMMERIKTLEGELIVNTKEAQIVGECINDKQLALSQNIVDNLKKEPNRRRNSDDVKQFAITLQYYSPKAYKYIGTLLPLPNPSLIKTWASSLNCLPGFLRIVHHT